MLLQDRRPQAFRCSLIESPDILHILRSLYAPFLYKAAACTISVTDPDLPEKVFTSYIMSCICFARGAGRRQGKGALSFFYAAILQNMQSYCIQIQFISNVSKEELSEPLRGWILILVVHQEQKHITLFNNQGFCY